MAAKVSTYVIHNIAREILGVSEHTRNNRLCIQAPSRSWNLIR